MENNKNDVVYLSFNGEDSSLSTFISYLIAAFHRQGISAFFDSTRNQTEAAVGREIEQERFSKLKVFVVVLSKSFESHLPLLEKHIYSCRNNNDFVVVPVFYSVSKSSVKIHMKKFGDNFQAIQGSMSKFRRGHEYDCEKSETDFVEEIARDVFENLYPTEEIGIQSLLYEVENLLCKQPWGVRTIGIFADSGFGKTTLAKAVFRQMSSGYDNSLFVKDFHTEYNEEEGLESLHPDYFSERLMEPFDLNSSDSKPCHRKKRILVCLDNVRDAQDAKTFLGRFDKFGPGSLIIITSVKRNILEKCRMKEIYELKGLNDENALKLFTKCAFGKDDIEENLLDRSRKAIKCCGGKPSTIRSKAEEFKGKAAEDTSMRTSPFEEDNELQENEFQSYHNAVLVTSDTKIPTLFEVCAGFGISKSQFRIYLPSGKFNIESLVLYLQQGIASEMFKKCFQSMLNTSDQIDLRVVLDSFEQPVHLDLRCLPTGTFIKVVSEQRESIHKGINGKSGTDQIDEVKLIECVNIDPIKTRWHIPNSIKSI